MLSSIILVFAQIQAQKNCKPYEKLVATDNSIAATYSCQCKYKTCECSAGLYLQVDGSCKATCNKYEVPTTIQLAADKSINYCACPQSLMMIINNEYKCNASCSAFIHSFTCVDSCPDGFVVGLSGVHCIPTTDCFYSDAKDYSDFTEIIVNKDNQRQCVCANSSLKIRADNLTCNFTCLDTQNQIPGRCLCRTGWFDPICPCPAQTPLFYNQKCYQRCPSGTVLTFNQTNCTSACPLTQQVSLVLSNGLKVPACTCNQSLYDAECPCAQPNPFKFFDTKANQTYFDKTKDISNYTNLCVSYCPTNYSFDKTANQCTLKICDKPTLLNWDGTCQANCTGVLLYTSYCLEKCPVSFVTLINKNCASKCNITQVDVGGICTCNEKYWDNDCSCKAGKFKHPVNQTCVDYCDHGYYADGNKCMLFTNICPTGYVQNYNSQCTFNCTGVVLNEQVCLEKCPDDSYVIALNRRCVKKDGLTLDDTLTINTDGYITCKNSGQSLSLDKSKCINTCGANQYSLKNTEISQREILMCMCNPNAPFTVKSECSATCNNNKTYGYDFNECIELQDCIFPFGNAKQSGQISQMQRAPKQQIEISSKNTAPCKDGYQCQTTSVFYKDDGLCSKGQSCLRIDTNPCQIKGQMCQPLKSGDTEDNICQAGQKCYKLEQSPCDATKSCQDDLIGVTGDGICGKGQSCQLIVNPCFQYERCLPDSKSTNDAYCGAGYSCQLIGQCGYGKVCAPAFAANQSDSTCQGIGSQVGQSMTCQSVPTNNCPTGHFCQQATAQYPTDNIKCSKSVQSCQLDPAPCDEGYQCLTTTGFNSKACQAGQSCQKVENKCNQGYVCQKDMSGGSDLVKCAVGQTCQLITRPCQTGYVCKIHGGTPLNDDYNCVSGQSCQLDDGNRCIKGYLCQAAPSGQTADANCPAYKMCKLHPSPCAAGYSCQNLKYLFDTEDTLCPIGQKCYIAETKYSCTKCSKFVDRLTGQCVDTCAYVNITETDAPRMCEQPTDTVNCKFKEIVNGVTECRAACLPTQTEFSGFCVNPCPIQSFSDSNKCVQQCSSKIYQSLPTFKICIQKEQCSTGFTQRGSQLLCQTCSSNTFQQRSTSMCVQTCSFINGSFCEDNKDKTNCPFIQIVNGTKTYKCLKACPAGVEADNNGNCSIIPKNKISQNSVYIIAGVVGGGVLIAIIVVGCICTAKNRKQSNGAPRSNGAPKSTQNKEQTKRKIQNKQKSMVLQ
ncbi:Conserved_hypothetical protein [Hexamita inflata]|uniref:Uncharacterized protein n=1 Tax=Hexamita inflata TaxID=28002 RepID=A0AA86NM05_9EUKA|nr:Conserved hypothetical protein [Hexamita inflata]